VDKDPIETLLFPQHRRHSAHDLEGIAGPIRQRYS
jgi:hypothetical protein